MNSDARIFQTGGFIDEGSAYYAVRPADAATLQPDAYQKVRLTLASTQSGKSSLAWRTIRHLAKQDARGVLVEYNSIGFATPIEDFLGSTISQVATGLDINPATNNAKLAPETQLLRLVEQFLAHEKSQRIVIFFDEIQRLSLVHLEGLCQVLQSIRQELQARALHARLGIHLLGFDWSGDRRSLLQKYFGADLEDLPLGDLTLDEMQVFLPGLPAVCQPKPERWLQLVHGETGGHPAWCQILLSKLAAARTLPTRPAERAKYVAELAIQAINRDFLSADPCLVYINSWLTEAPSLELPDSLRIQVLETYRQLRDVNAVTVYREESKIHRILVDIGMARVEQSSNGQAILHIRNVVIARCFDEAYIRDCLKHIRKRH